MKYLDSVRRAGRSLKSAKSRTILTALAIAVGAFTLTLSLAIGTGARHYTKKLIESNIDPQALFIARDSSMFGGEGGFSGGLREYSPDTTQYGGATLKALTQKDIETVKANQNVMEVHPVYIVSAQYFTVEGSDKKFVSDISAYDATVRSEVAAGTLPPLGTQLSDDGIVIPEGYLENLPNKPSPSDLIGKTITLHLVKPGKVPSEAEIQQILSTGGQAGLEQAFAAEETDVNLKVAAVSAKSSTTFSTSNGLFISENKAKELSEFLTKDTDQYQKYMAAGALVKSDVNPETVKDELQKTGLTVRTAKDLQQLLFTIVNILQGIVTGFGILALIASLFGIINTQYISVLERTREIGLMKALGMRGRHVSRLFQLEAAWIGLLGGIIGAGLAYIVGTLINPWLSKIMSLGENRIIVFELLPIAALILALILIAMIAGWFPARKAAKLDPIEALRTE